MKNILKISMLGALLLTVTALVSLPNRESQAGTRCEKCSRGDDGKMVCEPIPCP